jgi:hypothetical protein
MNKANLSNCKIWVMAMNSGEKIHNPWPYLTSSYVSGMVAFYLKNLKKSNSNANLGHSSILLFQKKTAKPAVFFIKP